MNLGVGASFDIGASVAKYDTLFLSGADITHSDDNYAAKMYQNVQDNPKSLICTVCSSYQQPRRRFYGADILFKITKDDLPESSPLRSKPEHRSILEGKWRSKTGEGTYPIPSLMGAFYGVSKEWYEFIRGFEFHDKWGSLEPYISLKSWLLGGEVLIDTDIDVLHKTGRTGFANKPQTSYLYNRMMISFIVFGAYGIQFMEHLGQSTAIQIAADMYMNRSYDLDLSRQDIEEKAVMGPEELHKLMVSLSEYHAKKGLKE
jgi:hypothetical protein